MDRVEGTLEVGCDGQNQIIINIPPLKKKREQHKTNCAYRGNTEELCNCGIEYEHIEFSPNQARNLARILNSKADEAERTARQQAEEIRLASLPPVDRSARVLLSGKSEYELPDYRETDSTTGMQKDYVVLSPEERAKGFVRPVRRSYRHLPCGAVTTMGIALAETYARDPGFYSGTMCVTCHAHFPLDQFVWAGTNEQVGT